MSEAELAKAKNYVALSFPSEFETITDLTSHLEEMAIYKLPDTYFTQYIANVQAVTAAAVQKAAATYIQPEKFAVVVVGDRKANRTGHPGAEAGAAPGDERGRGGAVSVTAGLPELLTYSDHERAKWRAWVEADPSRLALPFQAGARFPTIGSVFDHVFLIERRHLSRLEGATPPDSTGVPAGDVKGLFEYADLVRADFRRFVTTLDDAAAAQPLHVHDPDRHPHHEPAQAGDARRAARGAAPGAGGACRPGGRRRAARANTTCSSARRLRLSARARVASANGRSATVAASNPTANGTAAPATAPPTAVIDGRADHDDDQAQARERRELGPDAEQPRQNEADRAEPPRPRR